ncbi:MAG: efflux RND transporter periplasmic adaptor subunit [Bacteroidales bacterium]|nr:efflux RND transporter periplasmic adaptor subunit [Bacteroidales bacterium]
MTGKSVGQRIFAMIGISIAILSISCAGREKGKMEDVPAVTVAQVEKSGCEYSIEYPGLVFASEEVSLSFKVSGTIEKILVKEGDRVRKGQIMARLDTIDYRNQLNATTAEYEAIMAEAGRVVELFNDDATTRSNYDKAVSGMKQIESKLKYHRNQLEYCYLRAPMDGVVSGCRRSEHENISAGMPVVQVLGTGSPEVEIHISDKIYINRNNIREYKCHLGLYPDKEFTLTPVSYSPSANSNQLYTVRLKFVDPGKHQLLQGMNATVSAIIGSDKEMTSVPTRSIIRDERGEHIMVVGDDNKAREVSVDVLEIYKNGSSRIDCPSLPEGCMVITSGSRRIKDGCEVRPIGPSAETNVGGLL